VLGLTVNLLMSNLHLFIHTGTIIHTVPISTNAISNNITLSFLLVVLN